MMAKGAQGTVVHTPATATTTTTASTQQPYVFGGVDGECVVGVDGVLLSVC